MKLTQPSPATLENVLLAGNKTSYDIDEIGDITLLNVKKVKCKDTGGIARDLVGIDGSNIVQLGNSAEVLNVNKSSLTGLNLDEVGGTLSSERVEGVGNYSNIRIKVLPNDFVRTLANESSAITTSGAYITLPTAKTTVACFSINAGMKATVVRINANNATGVAINVYECFIDGASGTSRGSGAPNADIDITDTPASSTNMLTIAITNTSGADRQIYGGFITIAAI